MYRSDGSKTHKICPGSVPASAIIAISMIVATADARGPHQGQCGCRRPFIALFVARKYKSTCWSSPGLVPSAIVAIGTVAIADAGGTGGDVIYIIAIGTTIATSDAGGPHQGQCGRWRPFLWPEMTKSRAGAIVAIAASLLTEAPVKASVDAGGPLYYVKHLEQSWASAIIAIVAIGTIVATRGNVIYILLAHALPWHVLRGNADHKHVWKCWKCQIQLPEASHYYSFGQESLLSAVESSMRLAVIFQVHNLFGYHMHDGGDGGEPERRQQRTRAGIGRGGFYYVAIVDETVPSRCIKLDVLIILQDRLIGKSGSKIDRKLERTSQTMLDKATYFYFNPYIDSDLDNKILLFMYISHSGL
ncbi:hypothetical protein GGX14DRAFT_386999 [Mycena pura]|uniref:Uncharacterized protein n=1 Tax=Mycena pura TaxID=153505 RepID=A0AAD6YN09_9AGAR|nr:hypothetical protein GGX14DRAFT_386999 [Mycena pura]